MEKQNLSDILKQNTYPGRGILLGRSADGAYAIVAYFIMGRSENSRNRIFIKTDDGIRTEAYNPAKMTDPSLIIYHPVRQVGRELIVTNGDQTDTIRDGLLAGQTFVQSLNTRTFEPDAPHYTPRISGLLHHDGSFQLSILKSADGNPVCCQRYFHTYDHPPMGEGRFIHTYGGDGTPLPSFDGEPSRVALDAPDAQTLAKQLWEALHPENKVSLFVRYIHLGSGQKQDVIQNKHGTHLA